MKVILAKSAGACYGVKRALDLALEASACEGGAYTLGPLIHNPRVVEEMANRNVHVVEDLSSVHAGTIVIRSHGAPPEVLEEIAATGLPSVDATCPHVARAQKAAAELADAGCRVIVVGEPHHPEVEGLTAYAQRAGAQVDVVASAADVPDDLNPPVGIVVQTTQRRENLDEVVAAVHARGIDPFVKETICSATRSRQEAAADLADEVDAMVVIGGRNSSNTTRLAEICRMACERTFHVESADEIDPRWFASCESVGVSAGASTPESQIASVVEMLESL